MRGKLRILIIGIGNPIPSFINRRLLAFFKTQNIELIVVAGFDQRIVDLPGVEIIRLGGKMTIVQKATSVLDAILLPGFVFRLMSFRSELDLLQRMKWAVVHLPFTRIVPPDIIHFQWLGLLAEFQWLRKYFYCPFVGSARGSQITVYPITRPGHRERIIEAIEQADHIHCVSSDIMSACEHLGAEKEKVFVNFNGINLDQFRPNRPKEFSIDRLYLISIGALMWRKGLVFQLQIVKEIASRGVDIFLRIVGSGIELEGLKYIAYRMGILDRVSFEGQHSEEEIIRLLNSSDVYLSTSVAEGLQNSLVEAAACGLPIVTFDCEGAREVVLDRVTGYIVPFGSILEAVEKLGLLQDELARRKMGSLARVKMEREFNEDYWVNEMIEKYQSMAMKKWKE